MFNMFPYANLHKINLDWIIATVNNAVSTIQHSVRQIEAALDSVNGLTGRVTALETATEQLQKSNSALQERVSHAETQITSLQSDIRQQGSTLDSMSSNVTALQERVSHAETQITTTQSDLRQQGSALDSLSSNVTALSTAVAGKAQLPIIINLSAADAFPAQIPAADQAQVLAARTALNTGTGAAQAHIEQQVDQSVPAVFNIRLSCAGDGILTGIMSQTIYDGNAQEYLSRITTVSINSSAMTWEMGSQTVKPGMEYMLRYNLQTLTPEAKRQARANISAAYTEDVAPRAIRLTATPTSEDSGTWTGATWEALVTHARAGGIITVTMAGAYLSFAGLVDSTGLQITTPTMGGVGSYVLKSEGTYSINTINYD